jgi:hypothetical protein
MLCVNENAMHLLEKNRDKINWVILSGNQNAIHLLQNAPYSIDYFWVAANLNSIEFLTQIYHSTPHLINWHLLSDNPNAVHLLQQHTDKIVWEAFSSNPNIFDIDYTFFKNRMYDTGLLHDIISNRFHPKNIFKFYGWGFDVPWDSTQSEDCF